MARDRTFVPPVSSKKFKISQDEIDGIRKDAEEAKILLKNNYLFAYFNNTKQSILDIHAQQLICDTTETTEVNGVKNSIIKPSRQEYAHLAGTYRFIEKFINDLHQIITICEDMEYKIKNEELEVEEKE
ncbi:MAG TPA: hypothetical protein VEL70_06480 [Candidatus Acidoferrum sp.]|nr:hypothetical protein [Candidatus Acidoferrum sp.]